MSQLACRCGRLISDTTDDLPYKAELLPDSHTDQFYFSGIADGLKSFVEQVARSDLAAWLREHGFKDDYPADLPPAEIFRDFVSSLRIRYKRDCYECESCGRLWVELPRQPNRFACYTPESQKYEAVLGATDVPPPKTSLERTRDR